MLKAKAPYGRQLAGLLIGLSLVISLGVAAGLFDPWLLPTTPGLEASGKLPTANDSSHSALDSAGLRFAAVGNLVAAAQAPLIEVAPGLTCRDKRRTIAGVGDPASWGRAGTIEHLTLHNTGTANGQNVTAEAIANWHVAGNGWDHAGYHLNIETDGSCDLMLDLGPNPTEPYAQFTHNQHDIAVVYAGLDVPTEAQVSMLFRLIPAVAHAYGLHGGDLYGHRDWSHLDTSLVAAGKLDPAIANNHVDPCASAAPCAWDRSKMGLPAAIDKTYGGQNTPVPTDPGGSLAGNVTFYGDAFAGHPLRCGKLLASDESLYRLADEHLAATFVQPDQTFGWPCGSWLRVSGADGKWVDVRVRDTGAFNPPQLLDLGQATFERLAPTSRGRLNVMVTYLARDDANCRYVVDSGYVTCYAFRDSYYGARGGGRATYGLPVTPILYDADGTARQEFERHERGLPDTATTFRWPADNRGLQIEGH